MTPAPGHTDSGGGREQVRDRRKCRNTDRGTESGGKRDSSRRKIQQAATAHISQKQRDTLRYTGQAAKDSQGLQSQLIS